MTIWSAEIKELETLSTSIKGRFPELEKELERLIKADDENMVLLYSRRCLEVIITDLCESELGRQRKTEPLKGIIDKLHHEEKVPHHIITSMHGLNDLSKFGAHPKEFDPRQVKPVLNHLTTIIEWYLKYQKIEIKKAIKQKEDYLNGNENMKVSIIPERGEEKEIQVKEIDEKKEIKIEEPVEKEIIEPEQEYQSDRIKPEVKRRYPLQGKPRVLIPVILITLVVIVLLIFLLNRHSKVKWATEEILPEIEEYINDQNNLAAFDLVQKAEKYISKNPKFKALAARVITKLTIITDPPGADVYIREYSDPEGEWEEIGKTPIDSLPLPNIIYYMAGGPIYKVRLEMEGYENVLAVIRTKPDTLFRKLFKIGTIPAGMVYVEGFKEEQGGNFIDEKNGFFIDRYEVTNKQFKDFIDKGGYSNSEYWKHEFIKDGKVLSLDEAMKQFTDQTGRSGPATWWAGDYAEGQDDYPVSGISWYEAAAYAEYAGKELPTSDHWGSAAGFYIPNILYALISKLVPVSNFNDKSLEPIGKFNGINSYGAFDMAGNVREWCWNETEIGRIIRGGAWDDASYMYYYLSQLPSFDRSPMNGFRCVKYIDKEKIPEQAFQPIVFTEPLDYSKEGPVSDNIFSIYRNQFLYDKKELNASIEKSYDNFDDYTIEKITYNAAYEDNRAVAYLFLPKSVVPPYQILVFFPGTSVQWGGELITSEYSTFYVDYIVKNGRAVMFPVYKGTFERMMNLNFPHLSHQYTEYIIELTKDFSRSIDYLETRSDIDMSNLGYYGVSWGGALGAIIPAVEDRLKISILVKGGLYSTPAYPVADQINYVPRIEIPVLMLNGKYDVFFPYESTVKPMFDLLGTPESDKCLCTYETDHYIPRDELIKETLNWLDKYFGPVK